MQGLFTTITNVNFDPAAVDALTRQHDASPGTGPTTTCRPSGGNRMPTGAA